MTDWQLENTNCETEVDPPSPVNPFVRLRYHYGMLLDAQDFRVEQNANVFRARLHQAALHGWGTVFGLKVEQGGLEGEGATERIVVEPGLAIDALGRDVFVCESLCLDIAGLHRDRELWSSLSRPTPPEASEYVSERGERRVDVEDVRWTRELPAEDDWDRDSLRVAYVVLRHVRCVSEPVPAVSGPCTTAEDSLVYSRLLDSYRVDLEAVPPQIPREIFGELDVAGHPTGRDALLEAALNADVEAAIDVWTSRERPPILLAAVLLSGGPADTVAVVDVDNSVRRLVAPGHLIAEATFDDRLRHPQRSAGFRIVAVEAEVSDGDERVDVHIGFNGTPLESTLAGAIQLHLLDRDSDDAPWRSLALDPDEGIDVDERAVTLSVELPDDVEPEHIVLQLHVDGAGPRPLVSDDGEPFAGGPSDPAAAHARGRDFSQLIDLPTSQSEDSP